MGSRNQFDMFIDRMIVHFKLRYSTHYKKAERHLHPCTLLCRVRIKNIPANDFSTGLAIRPDAWDQTNQRVHDNAPLGSITIRGEHQPDSETANEALNKIRLKFKTILNHYQYTQQPITAQQIRDEYLNRLDTESSEACGIINKPTSTAFKVKSKPNVPAPITLADLLTKHLDDQLSRVVPETDERSSGIVLETWKVYRRYTNALLLALSQTDLPFIPAVDLDEDWIVMATRYLQSRYDDYYAAKQLYYLKTTLKFGVRKKLLTYNPIAEHKIDRNEPDSDLVFLYDHELTLLEKADFSQYPVVASMSYSLDRSRDAFLVMREIGQHYADYIKFVNTPVKYTRTVKGIEWFRKRRQKTKEVAIVPISNRLEQIASKYGGFANLPIPSNKDFNRDLKMIAVVLGISKNLTTKAARKTFADHQINEQGMDLDTVARMMGLSSTEYLKKYGELDERGIMRKMGLVPKKG